MSYGETMQTHDHAIKKLHIVAHTFARRMLVNAIIAMDSSSDPAGGTGCTTLLSLLCGEWLLPPLCPSAVRPLTMTREGEHESWELRTQASTHAIE